MSETNVMKQVKTRKPRAKPAPRVSKPKQKNYKFSKTNPYSAFLDIPIDEMSDAIDAYILTLNESEIREITTMYKLKTSIPWSDIMDFFEYMRQGQSIWVAFSQYTSEKKLDIQAMRTLLEQRSVGVALETIAKQPFTPLPRQPTLKPVNAIQLLSRKYAPEGLKTATKTQLLALAVEEGIKDANYLDKSGLIIALTKIEVKRDERVAERTFYSSEFKQSCLLEYRQAPWMSDFVNIGVNGMAVNPSKNPLLKKYATKVPVGTYEEPGWFRVTASWYEISCRGERPFIPDAVAYVLTDSKGGPEATVIIEDEEMYNASKIKATKVRHDVASDQVSDLSRQKARVLLLENDHLTKYGDEINDILISMPTTTNRDVAKYLSNILVYLQPLIVSGVMNAREELVKNKYPQIHIVRVDRGQYELSHLVRLSETDTLEEVFENPIADKIVMRRIIASRRAIIETEYLNRLTLGPVPPASSAVFTKPTISIPVVCSSDDYIYYQEGAEMFCFDRADLRRRIMTSTTKNIVNPVSGKPFTSQFISKMRMIHDLPAQPETSEEPNETAVVNLSLNKELAPGLFGYLRQFIIGKPHYCSKCNIEIATPMYRSVHKQKRVEFCSSACFETYKFK